MATVASQLILHPVASQTVKVLNTTVGRDKVYRALQYFARAYAWFLISRGYKLQAARWDALKGHLGTGRKLMRLGKPLEHLQAALKASYNMTRPGEALTTIGRQLGYAGYLIFDAVVWANSIRFITLAPADNLKFTKRSFRLWLIGILFSICNGILKAGRLANEAKALRSSSWGEKTVGSEAERSARSLAVERERSAVRYQFVLDLLDVWIPATNLGYTNLNDGFLGVFGLISSLMALKTQWQAVNSK